MSAFSSLSWAERWESRGSASRGLPALWLDLKLKCVAQCIFWSVIRVSRATISQPSAHRLSFSEKISPLRSIRSLKGCSWDSRHFRLSTLQLLLWFYRCFQRQGWKLYKSKLKKYFTIPNIVFYFEIILKRHSIFYEILFESWNLIFWWRFPRLR